MSLTLLRAISSTVSSLEYSTIYPLLIPSQILHLMLYMHVYRSVLSSFPDCLIIFLAVDHHYLCSLFFQPSSPPKQEPSKVKETASPERSASAPESLPSDQVPPSDSTLAPEGPHKELHSAPLEGRIEA